MTQSELSQMAITSLAKIPGFHGAASANLLANILVKLSKSIEGGDPYGPGVTLTQREACAVWVILVDEGND